jgi:integrase
VFINPDTAKPYTDVKTAFGTACELGGIENLHWHDLRHTFGTRLAEAGCSEATIADLMGHSDPQTTRRYTHALAVTPVERLAALRCNGLLLRALQIISSAFESVLISAGYIYGD